MATEPIEVSLESDNEKEVENEDSEEQENELRCNINQLSEQQYQKIIKELQAGKKYKYFKLKVQKNGVIKLEKVKPQSKIQTYANNTKTDTKTNNRIYLTNEQMLIENVRELTKEVERLRTKNKKRKHENRELYNMYYVDESSDNETPDPQINSNNSNIKESEPAPRKPIHWSSRIKTFK
jgi:hypothetical protein